MVILLTGVAGFIGFSTALALIEQGHKVIGIDNLDNYYDVSLKQARIEILKQKAQSFVFFHMDICDHAAMLDIAQEYQVSHVIHLAAKAGVRHSTIDPWSYIKSNIEGHLSILELCRHTNTIERLVYASSSSVYGSTQNATNESVRIDDPVSLYAATKASDELMTTVYSKMFGINAVGLRFFTVYGPWGRPDMALLLFIDAIYNNKPVQLYNNGNMRRDFTYINDIVSGIIASIKVGSKGHKLYNLGKGRSVELKTFLKVIENEIGRPAQIKNLPMQPGDVLESHADISAAQKDLGFDPKTDIEEGIRQTVQWYRSYYKLEA